MTTIIVGGGVQGLACAFALARRGIGSITLLEAKRIGYGESSRGGGGTREQFKCEPNIRLAQWSKELIGKLAGELGYHPLYHRGGYLYLHYTEKSAAAAEADVKLQNRLGARTRLISPREAAQIVPGLNVRDVIVGQYNADDGSFHHDALLWGYWRKLNQMGVTIRQRVPVTGLDVQARKISGVWVSDERLPAEQVIIAAGTWTREIMKTVNIDVPTQPYRREEMVTESVRHFLEPFVIDKRTGASFHQTVRGEILASAFLSKPEPTSMNWNARRPTLEKWSREIKNIFPALASISIIRQWAGSRDFTPDGSALFGPVCEFEGLWMVCGQSGTGLMLAPAIAEAIARGFVGEPPGVDWETYSARRFERGQELWERSPNG